MKIFQNLIKQIIALTTTFLVFFSTSFAQVNINTANEQELQTLKGIGEIKAKSIVDYRTENGDFSAIEDITNVSGIGEAMFNTIKDDITVN